MTILSLVPKTRGLGYLIVDSGEVLDWGIKRWNGKGSRRRMVEYLLSLIHLGDVEEVLLPEEKMRDTTESGLFLDEFIPHLRGRGIEVTYVGRENIKALFGGGSRESKAHEIAEVLPFLRPYLGRKKRLWESEGAHMLIFDAASLLLAERHL
jgi:hypothetical protein